MDCAGVMKRMPQFSDDMLDDSEYQQVRRHLAECAGCRERAGSIGSFTQAITRLGDVEPPADLASAILFRFTGGPEAGGGGAARAAGGRPGSAWIALVALAVTLGAWGVMRVRRAVQDGEAPVIISATIRRPPPHPDEAAAIYGQLQAMARALGVPEEEQATERGMSRLESDVPLRWDLRLDAAGRRRLFGAIEEYRLKIEHESPDVIILAVPRGMLASLARRLGGVPGASAPALPMSVETVHLTIHLIEG